MAAPGSVKEWALSPIRGRHVTRTRGGQSITWSSSKTRKGRASRSESCGPGHRVGQYLSRNAGRKPKGHDGFRNSSSLRSVTFTDQKRRQVQRPFEVVCSSKASYALCFVLPCRHDRCLLHSLSYIRAIVFVSPTCSTSRMQSHFLVFYRSDDNFGNASLLALPKGPVKVFRIRIPVHTGNRECSVGIWWSRHEMLLSSFTPFQSVCVTGYVGGATRSQWPPPSPRPRSPLGLAIRAPLPPDCKKSLCRALQDFSPRIVALATYSTPRHDARTTPAGRQ